MPKGIYTQTTCVLLSGPATLDELTTALDGFEICKRIDRSSSWELGGPTLVIAYRPDVNGFVAIDVVNRQWPDSMGDPQSSSTLFGAWVMGQFGPFTFPRSMERAAQQAWAWEDGPTAVERHQGFIRIRLSYAFGLGDDQPIMPESVNTLDELDFLTQLTESLLSLPQAICYFNPNGEVLKDRANLKQCLEFANENEMPPIDAWANVRLFNINEQFALMDSVGNQQMNVSDFETVFCGSDYDPSDVDAFMRNGTLYLLENGDVIKDGDTMDGPGDVHWQVTVRKATCDPPRDVLRWRPLDNRDLPAELLAMDEANDRDIEETDDDDDSSI
ncbi:MAG: DUF4261 domain-containing protein [Planctomycetaceae bacterium]